MKSSLIRYPTMHSQWFLEQDSANEGSFHSLKNILYSGKSEYQKIEVIVTGSYGKTLVLDGKVQSTEADEFIYHESFVHPSMVALEKPVSVLIAGGGEGATAREIIRYPSIRQIDIVDLDQKVIEIAKSYLSEWHQGTFMDEKVKVYYNDARAFIEKSQKDYDLIFADLPEPFEESPALKLYTIEFYRAVHNALNDRGIFVTQATAATVNNYKTFIAIASTLKRVFPIVCPYTVNVPSFHAPWGFVLASKAEDPTLTDVQTIAGRIAHFRERLKFYDEYLHRSLFCLPKYLREALEKETTIITDSSPVSFY